MENIKIMKIRGLIIGILFLLSTTYLQAQNKMFDKFSNEKNISIVYVSKALLNMMPNMDMGGANVKGLAGKLDQIEIYTSENKDAMKMMKSETESMRTNKAYEVLMSVKEGDENTVFYAQKDKDKFKDLVMLVSEPNEFTIIRIMGSFTAEDIQKVVEDRSEKKKK